MCLCKPACKPEFSRAGTAVWFSHYVTNRADRKSAIRQQALELGLLAAPVPDDKFIRTLRRSVDANDAAKTARFRKLAEFCAQPQ